MALLFFDGFEMYGGSGPAAVQSGLWKSLPTQSLGTNTPRTGGRVLEGSFNANSTTKTFDPPPGHVFIGFGYRPATNASFDLLRVRGDVSGNLAVVRVESYVLSVQDGSGATVYTHEPSLPGSAWSYLELEVKLGTSDGRIVLRINGVEMFAADAIDTQHGSNTGMEECRWLDVSQSTQRVDDIYICDDTGESQNTFLGPVKVWAVDPASDVQAEWTPDSGADNYARVALAGGHDGDSSYVASSTVGHKDLYGTAALPGSAQTPVAVQLFHLARKDGVSGAAGYAALFKSGTTEIEGTEVNPDESYALKAEPLHAVNPDTDQPWDVAGVNALQIGALLKAS